MSICPGLVHWLIADRSFNKVFGPSVSSIIIGFFTKEEAIPNFFTKEEAKTFL